MSSRGAPSSSRSGRGFHPARRGRGHGQSSRGGSNESFRTPNAWRGSARRLPLRRPRDVSPDYPQYTPSPQPILDRSPSVATSYIGRTPSRLNLQEPSPRTEGHEGEGNALSDSTRVVDRDESYYLGTSGARSTTGGASGPSTPQPSALQSQTPQTIRSSLFRKHAPKAFVRTDSSGRLTLIPAAGSGHQSDLLIPKSTVLSWSATERASSINREGDVQDAPSEVVQPSRPNHEKRILAITSDRQYLGCAYFDPELNRIYVMDDVSVPDAIARRDMIEQIREQAEADIILTSTLEEDEMIQQLRQPVLPSGIEPTYVEIRPRAEFGAGVAKSHLLMAQIQNSNSNPRRIDPANNANNAENHDVDEEIARKAQRQYEMNTWIEGTAYQAIGCAGALIQYLSSSLLRKSLTLELDAIEKMTMSKVMHLNADALKSLSIFSSEGHPNAHMMMSTKKAKSKEGLSILGILDICHTTDGHNLLRTWLRRPSQELSVLAKRYSAIRSFLAPENQAAVEALHSALKDVKNIRHVMDKMRRGNADSGGWFSCLQTVFSMVKLSTYCGQIRDAKSIEVVLKLMSIDSHELNILGQMINGIVDFDQSTNTSRVIVKHQVDDNLDALRHDFAGLDSFLSLVADRIIQEHSDTFSVPLGVVYFPQIGYLISLPLPPSRDENEFDNLPPWTFLFKSEDQAYFRSSETRELDETIGDIFGMITDLEIEIIHRLNLEVLKFDKVLLQICELCAELDVLLAFAEVSRKYNYTEPSMTEENVIDIEEGWHPLQELCVEAFVSNNVQITGGNGIENEEVDEPREGVSKTNSAPKKHTQSVIIMTGANASGKSIYLRQVALIVYMAHIGCFVPAARARIGLHDQILTRIATRESVSRQASAFMIDTEQMSYAIRNSTAKSLIIIDEYGKGTDNEVGAGLFAATIMNFLKRGKDCPKVVAATHFHEVFERQCLHDGLPLRILHMQILLYEVEGQRVTHLANPMDCSANLRKITYLFRLQEGRAPSSHAMNVALMHGIPKTVVERAVRIADQLAKGEEIQVEDTPKDSHKWAVLEELARQFVEWDLEIRPADNGEMETEVVTLDDVKQLLDWFDNEMTLGQNEEKPDKAIFVTDNSTLQPSDDANAGHQTMQTIDTSTATALDEMGSLDEIDEDEHDSSSQRSSTNFSAFEVTSLEMREIDRGLALQLNSDQQAEHGEAEDRVVPDH